MAFLTRAALLTKIAALFPKASMANPTNSAINDILTDMQTSLGEQNQGPVTSTADGLTTGLINTGETWIPVTSASANNIVTLPDHTLLTPGHEIEGYVGANGFKLSTPAASGQLINNVDSDGTQRCAIPANSWWIAKYVDATQGWIVIDETRLGARTAAIVPA
jgi:hypothetical protein